MHNILRNSATVFATAALLTSHNLVSADQYPGCLQLGIKTDMAQHNNNKLFIQLLQGWVNFSMQIMYQLIATSGQNNFSKQKLEYP
jgi:hypothetical protein